MDYANEYETYTTHELKEIARNRNIHVDHTHSRSSLIKMLQNRPPPCSGCFPIFQPNQLGHVGLYGCLSDDIEI